MNYRNESEECTRRIDIPVDDDAPTMTLAVPRVRKMRQRSEREMGEMGEAGRARKLEAERDAIATLNRKSSRELCN